MCMHMAIHKLIHDHTMPPQLCRSSVAIDTLQYSCVVVVDHKFVILLTRTRCEFDNVKA